MNECSKPDAFATFKKTKDFLVCVDSDGCAIDSMDIKHHTCFGPKLVEVFGPFENNEAVLHRWNVMNLYSGTRGINRFDGLARMLTELGYPDAHTLAAWVNATPQLSPAALAAAGDAPIFAKALEWSRRVNEAIEQLPLSQPFEGVSAALAALHQVADLAVVSSANAAAVQAEWGAHGLLAHTDLALAQDAGTKAACIARLLRFGYRPQQVLMVGDAPGDLSAAQKNGVWFYPIRVGWEAESWRQLQKTYCAGFLAGSFGQVQQGLLAQMQAALQNAGT